MRFVRGGNRVVDLQSQLFPLYYRSRPSVNLKNRIECDKLGSYAQSNLRLAMLFLEMCWL